MTELKKQYEHLIKVHPEHIVQIANLYKLALDEIEAGESPDNELTLFINSVEQLVS